MPKLFADVLFCLSSVSQGVNENAKMYTYARRHLQQRLKVEDGKESSLDVGMAYSEMGYAFLANDMYDKAIECCETSSAIYKKTPEYLSGDYWPHFAISHQAWALLGLHRGEEAVPMLLETLRWRESKFGKDDTESAKYTDSSTPFPSRSNTDSPFHRLGFTLHVLGRIRAQQGLWDESFDSLQRALVNFRATVGKSAHRTAAVCVTLAEHLARFAQPGEAKYPAKKILP